DADATACQESVSDKRANAQAQNERVGAGSANRTLLHQEPNHGAVRESHLSGCKLVRHRSRRGNLFWQAGERFDTGRSSVAGRSSKSADRILAHRESGESKRTT